MNTRHGSSQRRSTTGAGARAFTSRTASGPTSGPISGPISLAPRLLGGYYLLTPGFMLLDFLLHWNVRLSFLQNYPGVRVFYAVVDRTPRVYPWLNEPGGGMLLEWKSSSPRTASIAYSTM